MALPVNLQTVVNEMDLPSDEMTAYINRKTGELDVVIDRELSVAGNFEDDGEADERASAMEEDDDFVALPDKFEIHEYAIMERFCHAIDDERVRNALLRAISGRGAFRHFKDRIHAEGIREDWYAFRNRALKRIAAGFLESQGIAFIDE